MNFPISLGILLFNEVEVLDFAGPLEVFSLAETADGQKAFDVKTVSQHAEMIKAYNGLMVQPDYSFESAPDFDVLIIPGGYGARVNEIKNEAVVSWIKEHYEKTQILASVCTGAFLLAKTGLLNKRRATTHWLHLEELKKGYPDIEVQSNVKFVDQGKIMTAAGVSAGINMSFHIVQKLIGKEAARIAAKTMEYDVEIL